MELATIVAGSDPLEIVGDPRAEIAGLACHTRHVAPGTLFFCVPGTVHDGHEFAGDALSAGATALVVERRLGLPVTQVVVRSVRRAMALVAATFYEDPSTHLKVAGVTGTNGKTTTAHVIASVFEAAGLQCALLGTVVNRINRVDQSVTLTTPDSIELQRLLREMVDAGDRACALEASSHAMMMDRTVGIAFDAVVFTNLTRDHLDFHGDLEGYYDAKRRLFLPDGERQQGAVAVVNVDDAWGRRLAGECTGVYGDDLAHVRRVRRRARPRRRGGRRRGARPARRGRRGLLRARGPAAWREAAGLHPARRAFQRRQRDRSSRDGAGARARGGCGGERPGVGLGCPRPLRGHPGRAAVRRPRRLCPHARLARERSQGRPLTQRAAGSSWSSGAAAIATAASGRRWVPQRRRWPTSRTSPPTIRAARSREAIIADILAGIPEDRRRRTVVEPDRRRAIVAALSAARAGDVVVIAGKGHETGQLIGAERLPFDDRQVADEVLRGMRRKGTS